MFTISKSFDFSASHQLDHLPADHPCARLHGHNYTVTFILEAKALDPDGFVLDFGDLAPVAEFIKTTFDHQHLNDVLPVRPTCELIAEYLFAAYMTDYPRLAAVRVSETPKTWAEYRP